MVWVMENSKIEWTHHTANLWWGCTEVHDGCDNCYARIFSNRYNEPLWGNDKPRKAIYSVWKNLDKFQRSAKKANEIHSVFVGSMMDIFEKSMPLLNPVDHYQNTDDLRQEFFSRIMAGLYPNLLLLLLTKRPGNISKYIPAGWLDEPRINIMYGTSPVDQKTADTLIPQLLKVPGKKFLSCEPMLGPVDLTSIKGTSGSVYQVLEQVVAGDSSRDAINWVIVGGESGHHKRPINLDWARVLRDQCNRSKVPFFFKQVDKVQPIPDDLQIRQFPETPS
jgi:protein gp37